MQYQETIHGMTRRLRNWDYAQRVIFEIVSMQFDAETEAINYHGMAPANIDALAIQANTTTARTSGAD